MKYKCENSDSDMHLQGHADKIKRLLDFFDAHQNKVGQELFDSTFSKCKKEDGAEFRQVGTIMLGGCGRHSEWHVFLDLLHVLIQKDMATVSGRTPNLVYSLL